MERVRGSYTNAFHSQDWNDAGFEIAQQKLTWLISACIDHRIRREEDVHRRPVVVGIGAAD